MTAATELNEYLNELAIPVVGVSEAQDGTLTVDYAPEATAQQISDGDALAAGWGSDPESGETKLLRRLAKQLFDQRNAAYVALRAVVIETLGYANAARAKHNDLLAWLGGQTTLTNRAQLNGFVLTEATPIQARNAIKARIDNGEADNGA